MAGSLVLQATLATARDTPQARGRFDIAAGGSLGLFVTLPKLEMRGGIALTSFALAAAVASTLATGRRLAPNVSRTVFAGDDVHSRLPLAVLRAATPDDHGASPPSELKIFAEDPSWASQVAEFVVATGADAQGVEEALNGVRDVSWAAGRTFRTKHVVLLAFAEDVQLDGDEIASCRLTSAMLAASKHTSEAHFILVADGFELDAVTREIAESALEKEGWRSFTAIEVPEFEGFSSAINRAVGTIPGNSLISVLSTSALLLPASAADVSASVHPVPTADKEAGSTIDGISSQESASDIFVAFEQIRSRAFARGSRRSPGEGAEKCRPREHGSQESPGGEGTPYDQYGHVRRPNDAGVESEGLLITVLPSHVTTGGEDVRSSHRAQGDRVGSSREEEGGGQGRHEEAVEDKRKPLFEAGKAPGTRFGDAAPLPLLVFDTGTFSALGELDERFAFQGGVTEWISRARLGSIDKGGTISAAEIDGSRCCCDASPRRCRRLPRRRPSERGGDIPPGPPCSDGAAVQHAHAREWGRQFVGLWPGEGARPSRGYSAETGKPDARRPGVGWLTSDRDDQRGEIGKRVSGPGKISGGDGVGQPRDLGDPRTSEDAVVDQWTRLPAAKLEALVQADADLFFLPLLLLQGSSDSALHKEADSARLCIAFHSEWMKRTPDKTLERHALRRRESFPVAVVVVVHDDISLMRATLEEVAIVVELILVVVSLTPWHGDAKDIAPTLDLLDEMVADVDSPTRGKLEVEVGSWATEAEQREHGNTLIREDPRNFFRVVVMDTDEFWHPVELAKALVLVTQHPEAGYVRARMDTYWASVRSVVSPPERLVALWLVDPHRCFWSEYREVKCEVQRGREQHATFVIDRSLGVLHHLSYVRVDKDLGRKMGTFSHAGEEESGWYKRSWLGWAANNSLTDLHPVVPAAYKRVAVQPLLLLTPALRALHLDERKGRDSAVSLNMPIVRRASPLAAPTTGGTHEEDGAAAAAVGRHTCRPEGEARGSYNETVLSSGSCCLRRKGSDSRCETNDDSVGAAGVRLGGCERILAAQWTERQRTMCLVPDVGGRTTSQ